MTIRLYDSRAQALRDFEPRVAGEVGIYVCGPTVQSSPHIGHLRSAVAFDVMRRWFEHRGSRVTLVRNVTDIDDKILANATPDLPWWALAYAVEREFTAGYDALGVLPPSYEPRATASIPQMQELIETLIERGHAYAADDGSGDVYFAVTTWAGYGELTHQKLDDMADSPDAPTRGKRDPRDFALWKGAKPEEPADAQFPSPWGPGRPGWHIECSAMSKRYLGPEFDIHGGGIDLRFPHHENELAQSAAAGDAFARYWVHNGSVNVQGQKMSKSLGNSVFAHQALELFDPYVLRYYMVRTHYRSTLDYLPEEVAKASKAVARIDETFELATALLGDVNLPSPSEEVGSRFAEAMDDDFNTAAAISIVSRRSRDIRNRAAHGLATKDEVFLELGKIRGMLSVLGLDPWSEHWRKTRRPAGRDWRSLLDQVVGYLMRQRETARSDKNYARADEIRNELLEYGVRIDDTSEGPVWSPK
ncbi:MAG: cysteine--tRNA ligase [Actinomycetales bacterium]|nr:cysteine--tRNA ligase [Actinomycetales bacterium]